MTFTPKSTEAPLVLVPNASALVVQPTVSGIQPATT